MKIVSRTAQRREGEGHIPDQINIGLCIPTFLGGQRYVERPERDQVHDDPEEALGKDQDFLDELGLWHLHSIMAGNRPRIAPGSYLPTMGGLNPMRAAVPVFDETRPGHALGHGLQDLQHRSGRKNSVMKDAQPDEIFLI